MHPLLQILDQLAFDRWMRSSVRMLLRIAWMGLGVWCLALGVQLAWGVVVPTTVLLGSVLVLVASGLVVLLRPRLTLSQAARRLDRRFGLKEQLATAAELASKPGAATGLPALQVQTATRVVARVQQLVTGASRPPWAEALMVIALALVLAGLWVLTGVGQPRAQVQPLELPPLAGPLPEPALPEEAFIPPLQTGPGPGTGTASVPAPGAGAALDAIAEALRDQSVTRPAAEALDRGDVAGAAASLRELADQAAQLSGEARAALADNLRDAAEQVQPDDPGLADQLRQSAAELDSSARDAASGLERLADALDNLGLSSASQPGEQPGAQSGGDQQGDGSQPPDQASAGAGGSGNTPTDIRQRDAFEPLGVEGVPLELDAEGEPNTTDGPATGIPSGTDASGFQGGAAAGGGQAIQRQDDPQAVPTSQDERDVVQSYFTP